MKYCRLNSMSLLKNSSIYLFSNILNALVPFLLLPILTHKLSPEGYGEIAMFQTLVSGLAALTGLNTIGAANRCYYDDLTSDELKKYNGACFHVLAISSFLLILLGGIFSASLSKWLSIPVSWIFFAIIVSAGNFIIQFRLGQWQIRGRAWRFGMFQVSQSLLLFLLTIAFLLYFGFGAASRINAMILAADLFSIFSFITLYKENLLALMSFRIEFIKDTLKFGVPLVPHIIGIFFLSAIDRILINNKLGVGEAGIYMLGVQLSLGMVVIFDAINKALIPWLFRILSANDIEKISQLVRFTYFYFIILAFLGGLSFWIGPYIVRWLAGSEYQQATSVIGWLCLGQAFNGMYLMVTNYLFYAKRTGRLSIVTISCGVLNILLLISFMKYNGIIGVAMAFALSMFIRFISTWILVLKLNIISWRFLIKKKM